MFGIDPRSSKTKEAVKLANLLPHGSGIDGDWLIVKIGNKLYAYNSYHIMNDYGFYVGWQDFYVVMPVNNFSKFKLHFQGNQYLAQRYDLRGYLEDIIAYNIIEL